MCTSMTRDEIDRALTLLEEDDLAEFNEVRVGRWILANDGGVFGVYNTKGEAVEGALARHMQCRKYAKVERWGKGSYYLSILDCDEDPRDRDRAYHSYTLERITEKSLLGYQEIMICGLLPEWYFNPYSQRYKEYFGAS